MGFNRGETLMTKPTNPNIEIPAGFAIDGQKSDFDPDKIQSGFDPVSPDVLSGDNLNKLIDDTYKGLHYSMDGVSDLYKGAVLYDSTETYSLTSLVFSIADDGQVSLYKSLVDNNQGNPLSDETKWRRVNLGGSGMSIGTLFPAFASSSYTPEYALSCDGSEYSSTMFPDLWTNYLTSSPAKLLTKNYTQYNSDITEYGNSGSFGVEYVISASKTGTTISTVEVTTPTWESKINTAGEYEFSYDGTNWSLNSETVTLSEYGIILEGTASSGDTVTVNYSYGTHFKVPTIKDGTFIQQAKSDTELGKAYSAGLPNIEGSTSQISTDYTSDIWGAGGAFYKNATYPNLGALNTSGRYSYSIGFDASGSSEIYGNSATVQPEAIALRWFVVVANSSENESSMDWSAWATSLNSKANTSGDNFTSEGKSYLSGIGMPSGNYIDLTLGANDSQYTAPANGWFGLTKRLGASAQLTTSVNSKFGFITYSNNMSNQLNQHTLPVKKGDTVTIHWSAAGSITKDDGIRFIYAQGEEE